MECDVLDCTTDAVAVLAFRGRPGHVHVCARHEAADREWCDIVWSKPMPCPLGCAEHPQPLMIAAPPLLP